MTIHQICLDLVPIFLIGHKGVLINFDFLGFLYLSETCPEVIGVEKEEKEKMSV